MAYQDLAGKSAIVTGAGGGIGAAIVRRLLAEGCNVLAGDSSVSALDRLAGECGGLPLEILPGDVTAPDCAPRMVERCCARHGGVDLLVCAAGILGPRAPVAEAGADTLAQILSVNVGGTFLFLRAVLPRMIRQGRGGAVVTLSSVGATRLRAGFGLYGASKAAITALSQAAAIENGPHGIRVNVIAPGSIDTPMLSGFAASAQAPAAAPTRPIARKGRPEEVAALAAWLLSAQSSYATGAVHTLDGGLSL
ncbi:SDR family NAD(P)-dependent oxidoreductase [Pseudogemmobacter sonorensis]|uniref:SDR family NAD(P)-dependent oxidoreductase n=1 Tax=Pseudogemmobacter sonorensis TaxID=2989681 RepID=UPI00368CD483